MLTFLICSLFYSFFPPKIVVISSIYSFAKIFKLFKKSFKAVFFFFEFSIFSSFFDFPFSNFFSRFLFIFYFYFETSCNFRWKFVKLLWVGWFVFFSKKKKFSKTFRFLCKFVCQSLGHFVFLRFFFSKKLWISWTSFHFFKKKKNWVFSTFWTLAFFCFTKKSCNLFYSLCPFSKISELFTSTLIFFTLLNFFFTWSFFTRNFFPKFCNFIHCFHFFFFLCVVFSVPFCILSIFLLFFQIIFSIFLFFTLFGFSFFFFEKTFVFLFEVFFDSYCQYSQFSTRDRMYITWTLYTNIFPSLFVAFFVCPQTDTAQLYNTQSGLCMRTPHLGRTGLESSIVFSLKQVSSRHHTWLRTRLLISHMVAERSSSKLQAHRSHRSTKDLAPWKAHTSETALAHAVNRFDQGHSTGDIQNSWWDETDFSMPMLVANGNKVLFRGENAKLITARGETAPLTSEGDDWYLKVLNNNSNEFLRIDVWTPYHVCPPMWARRWNNVNSMLREKRLGQEQQVAVWHVPWAISESKWKFEREMSRWCTSVKV